MWRPGRWREGAGADGNADSDEQEDLPHDHPAHGGTRCSEGHADADLIGAPADNIGHEAVDADGGEEDGEQAEEGGELRD